MQRETLQICAAVLPSQTSKSQIAPAMERDDRREGWWEWRRAGWKESGGGRDKCSECGACAGKLRIGQHVNLNPFGERRKHTRRENRGLSGEERDVRSLSLRSLLHPLSVWSASCRQQLGNPSVLIWSQPLNHSLHLAWLFLLLHPLFHFWFLFSHLSTPQWHSPELCCLDPVDSSVSESSFQSTHFSFQLSVWWLIGTKFLRNPRLSPEIHFIPCKLLSEYKLNWMSVATGCRAVARIRPYILNLQRLCWYFQLAEVVLW